MSKKVRKYWICEVHCRAVDMILVEANSRREAQKVLDEGGGQSLDMTYHSIGRPKVIRESKNKK